MGDNDEAPSGKELEKEPPFPLTEVDKWVLSQTDEEFHLHNWDELRDIIGRYRSIQSLLCFCELKCICVEKYCCSTQAGPLKQLAHAALDELHVIELPRICYSLTNAFLI